MVTIHDRTRRRRAVMPVLEPEEGRALLLDSILEKPFQAQIIQAAGYYGYTAYHTYRSTKSPEGFPDLVLAKPGCRLIFLEVKRMRGKQSAAQVMWQDLLRATGNVCEVVRPSDWLKIEALLKNEPMTIEGEIVGVLDVLTEALPEGVSA